MCMHKGIKCELNGCLYGNLSMHNGYELKNVFGIDDIVKKGNIIDILSITCSDKYNSFPLVYRGLRVVYSEKAFHTKSKYLYGYWMNDQYFRDIESELKTAFDFKNIDDFNVKLSRQLSTENSVSLHIRRGDYINLPNFNICGESYYKNAISYIEENVRSPKFYIFSDDPEWCETYLKQFNIDYRIIKHNTGTTSFRDMFLMSKCKHNIIANSTFSWWGAWLNNNSEKIVIAPERWWKDTVVSPVPSQWTKIKNT